VVVADAVAAPSAAPAPCCYSEVGRRERQVIFGEIQFASTT